MNINIKFQAYIPKNTGQSLKKYFSSHIGFHPERMSNYAEFKKALEAVDKD